VICKGISVISICLMFKSPWITISGVICCIPNRTGLLWYQWQASPQRWFADLLHHLNGGSRAKKKNCYEKIVDVERKQRKQSQQQQQPIDDIYICKYINI
jgi:hypothetical protein